jgi:hypothetical protein
MSTVRHRDRGARRQRAPVLSHYSCGLWDFVTYFALALTFVVSIVVLTMKEKAEAAILSRRVSIDKYSIAEFCSMAASHVENVVIFYPPYI